MNHGAMAAEAVFAANNSWASLYCEPCDGAGVIPRTTNIAKRTKSDADSLFHGLLSSL
jgi:hypothetical protein